MQMKNAKSGSLAERFDPLLGRQLRVRPYELRRVGAVGTSERTAVGELGKHRDGRRTRDAPRLSRGHICEDSQTAISSVRRLRNSRMKPMMSWRTCSFG